MNYTDLLAQQKVLVEAHAGCGKTHTIATCVSLVQGRSLILTHTHAGVASIRAKLEKQGVDSSKYKVSTIDSYVQKYVLAFYMGNDIPQQNDSSYYAFILAQAVQIFKTTPVRAIIKNSYTSLFVDEYQDCTKLQHKVIMQLAGILKIYLFGDSLQGIFNFSNNPTVSFDTDLPEGFLRHGFILKEPYRWKEVNENLGHDIEKIRNELELGKDIDLYQYPSIRFIKVNDRELARYPKNEVHELITQNGELLFITPHSYNIEVRLGFASKYRMRVSVLEANTERDFFILAQSLDAVVSNKQIISMTKVLETIFKSSIGEWINLQNGQIIRKRSLADQKYSRSVKEIHSQLLNDFSLNNLKCFLIEGSKLPRVKCYRKELFADLIKSLDLAMSERFSIYEAMCQVRNKKAVLGRTIKGRYIGTTLLTKGLEFKTVVILDAQDFKDPKNFYVAISRAQENLIIFSSKTVLHPYS